ncbi:unnamed protein product [Trichogramma brassicae]|uniref:Uncharacterized protein n=1 Tax=Trichogramma brassicae TaxID=86971 RepID=A0A6H5I9T8_9HYME|nr:unnamed protein product [Trichogramma brassicae]
MAWVCVCVASAVSTRGSSRTRIISGRCEYNSCMLENLLTYQRISNSKNTAVHIRESSAAGAARRLAPKARAQARDLLYNFSFLCDERVVKQEFPRRAAEDAASRHLLNTKIQLARKYYRAALKILPIAKGK